MKKRLNDSDPRRKVSSGIGGFDEITHGGLPRGRSTVLLGAAGSGKTILALEFLVNAAVHQESRGIFVAFEEKPARVIANAEEFGWKLSGLEAEDLFFLDARTSLDDVRAGAFDLIGMLATLEAKAGEIGAKMIVFDAIDVLLSRLDDPATERLELQRIHNWLEGRDLTVIFTMKLGESETPSLMRYDILQYMADCVVMLRQRAADRVTVREMRVLKLRGSAHVLNDVPFVIGPKGLEVGSSNGAHPEPQPFDERLSSGVAALDGMLDGGYFRGTNALISGGSGTGKTTLAGSFVEAACQRGERALFIAFDENTPDVERDLSSVSIQLKSYHERGLLRMESLRSAAASAEEHFVRVKHWILEHKPKCLAIDPLSALLRAGDDRAARGITERLIYLCRNAHVTVLFTSQLDGVDPQTESALSISAMADTWLQISYELHAGERNRALSIIKSRGSKHSNQIRELIFSNSGVTLTEPYMAGGEVLMGTLRIQKEKATHSEDERKHDAMAQGRRVLEQVVAKCEQALVAAGTELRNRSAELLHLTSPENEPDPGGNLRQDKEVRQRDEKLVTGRAPIGKAEIQEPAPAGAKRRAKKK